MSDDGLEGKVAVVTGAARGFGFAIAEELTARGATVVVSDIDEDAAGAAAERLDRAEPVACDVRDEQQVADLINGVTQRHDALDVVVANAGIGAVRPLVEMSLEEWRAVMAINLDGTFLTVRAAGAEMARRGSGAIVTTASITALAGSLGIGHYAAAKAGVINLTKTLAAELRPSGVRANAICPGFADTQLVRDQQDQLEALLPEGMTLDELLLAKQGGWGRAEDVAGAVCFLAGKRAAWITGTALVIDGGMRASLL